MSKSCRPGLGMLMAWSFMLLMVQACASTPPPKFYVLSSLSDLQQDAPVRKTGSSLCIGVGPVRIPNYLDRMQIVTRSGQSTLDISEYHRWAEPLDRSIERVVGDNLSRLLETDNIVFYPWHGSTRVDSQVAIDVTRLDGAPGQKARLEASWTIFGDNGKRVILRRSSVLSEPVDGASYEALVATLSRMMGVFSRELATAIAAEVKSEQGA